MLLQTPEHLAKITYVDPIVEYLATTLDRIYTPPHMENNPHNVEELKQILQTASQLTADLRCQRALYIGNRYQTDNILGQDFFD